MEGTHGPGLLLTRVHPPPNAAMLAEELLVATLPMTLLGQPTLIPMALLDELFPLIRELRPPKSRWR
jgi:hypothetical protein